MSGTHAYVQNISTHIRSGAVSRKQDQYLCAQAISLWVGAIDGKSFA